MPDQPVALHEETDVLQFRSPNQPNLHLIYWTRSALTDKPSPAILIINHGFGEHSGRYRKLVSAILAGVPSLDAVISYDMRSHGQSEGVRGAPKSIDEYTTDLCEHVLPRVSLRYGADARVVLLGHSLGGAVVSACSTRPDCLAAEGCGSIKGIILSAPCLEVYVKGAFNKTLLPFAGYLVKLPGVRGIAKPTGLDANLLSKDKKVVEDYQNDELTYDMMSVGVVTECLSYSDKIIADMKAEENCVFNQVPTLVLHGTGDAIVKIDGSRKLVAALQEKGKTDVKLVEIEDAYHEVHNETPEDGCKLFVDSVVEFLTNVFAA